MGINENLKQAVLLNIADAKELVRILRDKGDGENLKLALDDLRKWEAKAKELGLPI